MADATLYENIAIKNLDNIYAFKYNIPSILATETSDLLGIRVPWHKGELTTIRIACASTNYDVHIYTKDVIESPSINEICKIIEIDSECQETVNIIYINGLDPVVPYLYIQIVNNDTVNATGVIDMQIIYKTEWIE